MKDIKSIVAKNITELRIRHNMTQLELAEKLNYSDKTISKWERAESTPDISVLVEIAALFGVTLDALASEGAAEAPPAVNASPDGEEGGRATYNRRVIAYIAESVGWVVSVLAFIITSLILEETSFQWLYFLYTLPVVLIVRLVFNSIWFNRRHNYVIISALMWSILAAIHITFLYFHISVALVYLLGVPGQAIIVLWSFIKRPKKK